MTYCSIHFRFKFHTDFNDSLRLLGNIDQLGAWRPSFGLILTTNPEIYPYWESPVPIKVPIGAKLEFKLAVFNDNHLKRWETLTENRYYRARYHSVMLQSCEADLNLNETILKKFVSSQSLENLDDYKRVKKTKQFFNPFDNAQNSFTSESWDESSMDKISSEDFTSPRYFNNPGLYFHNEEQTQDTEGVKTEMDFPHHAKDSSEPVKLDSVFKKQMNRRMSPTPTRKKTLNPHEVSDLETTLQALNDERPDIFSVLYQKHRNEKGMARHQATSLINSESREDLLVYELENELVSFGSNETVLVTCFKLPITVSLMNPNEGPVSKQWRVTEDTDSHLNTIYKFRHEKAKGLVWIGWIGTFVEEKYREELANFLYKEYSCIPIFLEEELVQSFLYGYCNKFLHNAFFANLTPDMIPLQEDYIDVFNKVNQIFASKVLEYANNLNVLVLVQDYHLMMVPRYIAQRNVRLAVVYIFDTPFPSLETVKAFYNRRELADSLLCSDLLCFSSNEHLKNFTRFSAQAAGTQLLTERGGHMYVLRGGRKIYLRTIQPCVDVQGIGFMKSSSEYQEVKEKMADKYHGKNLLVGFCYFKRQEAIENLLAAFKTMAEAKMDQSYHLVIVYTEDFYLLDSQTSEKLCYLNTIKEQILNANRTLTNSSIELIEEDLSSLEKFALLELASLLISFSPYIENDLKVFEYLLIKNEYNPSGILLSDFSGGSRQFGLPVTVNPFSKTKISESITKILSLDKNRIKSLMSSDQTLAGRYTAWDQYYELFTDMKRAQTIKNKLNLMLIEENNEMKIISVKGAFRSLNPHDLKEAFKQAHRKVIICSYEDTLILEQILSGNTEVAGPVNVPTEGIEVIKRLCMDPTVEFFVISEKKVDTLAGIFEEVPNVSLLAENGFFYKMSYETNWYNMYECDWSWKGIVQRIMQNYAVRIGGVKVEVKESSILWDYKDVDNEIVKVQEIELASHLATVLTHVQNLEVIRGKNTVEVKAAGVNKGVASELILNRERLIKGKYPDFVFCLGGTRKDEEMFSRLGKMLRDGKDDEKVHWFTCTVGKKPSNARYYVDKVSEVYEALNLLVD